LTIGAIITFGFLLNSALNSQLEGILQQQKRAAAEGDSHPSELPRRLEGEIKLSPSAAGSHSGPGKATGEIDSLMLHSFLIPSKLGGETVFYKLRVELVVKDTSTKHALARREAWVRDIVYQELKGMRISRGSKGDVLARYKKPLLERLNKALRPYGIDIIDVRMSGYILK
jgi:hypothetical protein